MTAAQKGRTAVRRPTAAVPERSLEQNLLALFDQVAGRLTPQTIVQMLAEGQAKTTARMIRAALKRQVEEGALRYTQRFGMTQVERNFSRLHQVSERIWLTPDDNAAALPPGACLLRLSDGTAFGGGDHPTTRLALQAIDRAAALLQADGAMQTGSVLDIGTGTGVLAIAAVALGLRQGLALDRDALACHEARINVAANRLAERICVSSASLATLDYPPFDLLTANLRPPTLKSLLPSMHRLTTQNGCWVLSGFRAGEAPTLRKAVEALKRAIIWEAESGGWGVWLIRRSTGR